MNNNMEKAISALSQGYTLVLCNGEKLMASTERGLSSLLKFIKLGAKLTGCGACDKVVGKSAAFLYVLLEIKEVYAVVISKPARLLLEAHGISVIYENEVDRIKNRNGDGFCPMESTVLKIDTPNEALNAILKKQADLENTNRWRKHDLHGF